MTTPEFVERRDPEEVFTLLSDDTRVEILRALWDTEDSTATFSELREAVGVRDSGQFNYHLDKLVGEFVTRDDEGYELTQAGRQINGAIEAGSYTIDATTEPVALDTPCLTCGGTRQLHYEDERIRVECESCPLVSQFDVPPSAFMGYDRTEIPAVAGRYLQTMSQHIHNGFCWNCDGQMAAELDPIDFTASSLSEELPEEVYELFDSMDDAFPVAQYDCQRCGITFTAGLRMMFLYHPAVAGFFHDHGVDVWETSLWEFATLHPAHERLRSRDPLRGIATYEIDDDTLTAVVDENLDLVAIEDG